jgi:hypothetical protein
MPENPPYKLPIDPPPAPRAAQVLALALAAVAAGAGFLGYCTIAGIAGAGSFVIGLVDLLRSLGTVNVPGTLVEPMTESERKDLEAKTGRR